MISAAYPKAYKEKPHYIKVYRWGITSEARWDNLPRMEWTRSGHGFYSSEERQCQNNISGGGVRDRSLARSVPAKKKRPDRSA